MATAKLETAADRYRRIRTEKAKEETLHDVDCECGMVWKARKVGIDFWVTSGILPLGLVETMLKATDNGKNAEVAVKSMAAKQMLDSIVFANKVVRHTAVEPRIVEEPKDANDISFEETMQCCYKRLLNWQMSGGVEAERLGNFPQG